MQRTYDWLKSWGMLEETASPLQLVNTEVQSYAHQRGGVSSSHAVLSVREGGHRVIAAGTVRTAHDCASAVTDAAPSRAHDNGD